MFVLVKIASLPEALQLLMLSVKTLMYLEPKLSFLIIFCNFYVLINKMSMSFSITYVCSLYLCIMSLIVVILNERSECKVTAVLEDKPNLVTK